MSSFFNKIKQYKKLSITAITIFLIIMFFVCCFIFKEKHAVKLDLIGEKNVYLSVGSSYKDLGFSFKDNDIEVAKEKIRIQKKDNIDINVLGEYELVYKITYFENEYEIKRNINIIDDIAPVIKVDADTVEKDYCTKKLLKDFSYEAIDNYDGDITENVIKEDAGDKIVLSVVDTSGNETKKEINVVYSDKPKTELKLNGNKTVYVALNTSYKDSGATYIDGCKIENESRLIYESNVDTSNIGEYEVKYSDYSKDKTVIRKVIVYNPSVIEEKTAGSEKIIYLTFDDGPGVYTEKILDTLSKYNIKATFFVTNQFTKYVHLIEKEHKEGHVVAVHTLTHKWEIYESVDRYLEDFNQMNNIIENYTGQKSNIFRFPGGSSNTISKKYAKGVVSAIASKMTEDGYVYFDWDVDSSDAAGGSEKQIFNNVVSGVARCNKCIVLMHDIKKNTANQLDNILNHLTSKGYKFGTLSINSPTVHMKINN